MRVTGAKATPSVRGEPVEPRQHRARVLRQAQDERGGDGADPTRSHQANLSFTGWRIGPWPTVVIHGSYGPASSMLSTCATIAPSSACASIVASVRPTQPWTP